MAEGYTKTGKKAKIATADYPMSDAKERKMQKALDRELHPKTGTGGQMPPNVYEIEPNSTADILQKLQILSVIQILFILAGFSINTSECLRKNIVNQSFLVIHQNDASFSLYVKCLRFVLTYLTGHFFLYLLTMLCEMSIIWLEYYYHNCFKEVQI